MNAKHIKPSNRVTMRSDEKNSQYRLHNLQIGKKLEYLRIKSGYSLSEFAELIHTTRNHLAKVEYGKIRPSYRLLCEIAYHLNMNADELMQFCTCKNSLNVNLLSYGEKIKYYRRKAVLTQTGLGLRTGLSTSEINLLESECRYPEYDEMKRIARVLNRKICDFYNSE